MSYADQADLSQDVEFRDRVTWSLYDESKRGGGLADRVLTVPQFGLQAFLPFVVTAPGFGDTYALHGQAGITDADLLSAVQANWAAVEALYPEQP